MIHENIKDEAISIYVKEWDCRFAVSVPKLEII